MKAARISDLESNARTSVVAGILEKAQQTDGITPAVLRSEHRFNPQVGQHLSLMAKNELLKYDAQLHVYKMTRKGEAFLRTYKQMDDFIHLIDEEIGL